MNDLKGIAERYGKSLPQLALRWAISHPAVSTALVGCRTVAEVIRSGRPPGHAGEIFGACSTSPDAGATPARNSRAYAATDPSTRTAVRTYAAAVAVAASRRRSRGPRRKPNASGAWRCR